jgi:hypothetical protein
MNTHRPGIKFDPRLHAKLLYIRSLTITPHANAPHCQAQFFENTSLLEIIMREVPEWPLVYIPDKAVRRVSGGIVR